MMVASDGEVSSDRHSQVLRWARRYVAAGLSVIPILPNGAKAPALGVGEPQIYHKRLPTSEELERWFHPLSKLGLAIVGGEVSGNFVALDFETLDAWERWTDRVTAAGQGAYLATLPIVQTPRGGRHVYCRLSDGWVGSRKLAWKGRKKGSIKTLIETKGEGGYVLAPGCPAECHPDGKLYTFVSEGWLANA